LYDFYKTRQTTSCSTSNTHDFEKNIYTSGSVKWSKAKPVRHVFT